MFIIYLVILALKIDDYNLSFSNQTRTNLGWFMICLSCFNLILSIMFYSISSSIDFCKMIKNWKNGTDK